MNISEDILNNLRDLFVNHRIVNVVGDYDGTVASVSLTFVEGDTETQEFVYTGKEVLEFREYLFQAAGECVKRHNLIYQPDRSEFISKVVGPGFADMVREDKLYYAQTKLYESELSVNYWQAQVNQLSENT